MGENVAIIGGGLTGCEIAYQLALEGKKPVIVEMLDDLIKVLGVNASNSLLLRDLIAFHKIPVYLESTLKEIKVNSVVIETKNGETEIPVDNVITSIGYIPGAPLIKEKNKNIHILGDAKEVGNLKTVIWDANELAISI